MKFREHLRAVLPAAVVLASATAQASGFEFPENGSLPMGRAGAFVARASDVSALMNNVAGIAALPGRFEIAISSNFFFLGHCFQRAGNYPGFNQGVDITRTDTRFAMSAYDNGSVRYPEVCNQNLVFPAPQLLAAFRVHPMVTIGVGLYGPNAVGRQSYPDVVNDGSPMTIAPSPNRYMLLHSDLLLFHPTLAVGIMPVRWLRVGIAVQPSVGHFSFTTMANAISAAAQSPDQDVSTTVDAWGFFMAGNVGMQIVPLPFLSFGLHAHFNQSVTASGAGTARYPYYGTAAPPSAPTNSTFTVNQMNVPLPQQIRAGIRFNLPRPLHVTQNDPHPNQPYDPMRDDIFDLELDAIFETSSQFDALRLQNSGNIQIGATQVPAPMRLEVPHNWSNVWGLRFGGDVNIVPNHWAMRAGVAYESGAQSRQYTHLDLPAYSTVGLHVGSSVRFGFATISIAYAHYFLGGMDNSTPGDGMMAGSLPTIGTMGALTARDCQGGTGADACAVNRGTFRASNDALHVGLSGRW